ncbi:MAG: alkaline phosphatase [Candidatus Kaiserbacteria bacterium]|nr:alkaline phosphatase [Candidatus Kaiserbacteria bacterium]
MDIHAILAFVDSSKYILLFLGCFFEGTGAMLLGGILWQLGIVQFAPMYLTLIAADLLADTCWYLVGYYGARSFINKWGHYIGLTPENVSKVEHRFHTYHVWILTISKLSMGFGLAVVTLTVAGMMRMSYIRFLIINALGSIVWILAMVMVGYYFGDVLTLIPHQYQIGFAVIVFALALGGLGYLSKRMAKADW